MLSWRSLPTESLSPLFTRSRFLSSAPDHGRLVSCAPKQVISIYIYIVKYWHHTKIDNAIRWMSQTTFVTTQSQVLFVSCWVELEIEPSLTYQRVITAWPTLVKRQQAIGSSQHELITLWFIKSWKDFLSQIVIKCIISSCTDSYSYILFSLLIRYSWSLLESLKYL